MSSAPRPSAMLELALEATREFAVVTLDSNGLINSWSAGAAAIAGYAPEEVLGKHFELIFTPEDREAGLPIRELEKARTTGRAEDRRWHIGKGAARYFADGVTTVVTDDQSRMVGFAKIFRDITDRYMNEMRLEAQLALAKVFGEEREIRAMTGEVMRIICEVLGWDYGELWTVDEDQKVIRCEDVWYRPAVGSGLAETLCADQSFERGVGLPGRVWADAKVHWIENLAKDPAFPRAQLATKHDLRSAFGFPIIRRGEVKGVLEFFSLRRKAKDARLLELLAPLGEQVGDAIERRRTTEALRESEERYRVISETARDAIVTMNEESTILFANPAVEALLGWRPEELIGKKLHTLIPERMHPAHDAGVSRYLRTKIKRIPWRGVELPGRHRNGTEVPLEIAFGEWQSEGKTIFSGFMRDIGERKRAREELERLFSLEQQAREESERANEELARRADEEESFRHLASGLAGATAVDEVLGEIAQRASVVTRADGVYVERIISHDGEVEVRATNGKGTPAIGVRVAYPGSLTEEILERGQPAILTDMSGIGPSMAPYLRETCGDCEVLVIPLMTGKDPLGALVLLNSRDSGRHFGEEDIAKAKTLGDLTSLALRRVRMMDDERHARTMAEEAVRSRDRTLGVVSHDLRTPLTRISLAAQLLEADSTDDSAEQIETIRTATHQMTRLIEDLLDAARIEQRGLRIQPASVDLGGIVGQTCDINRALAAQRLQTIECNVDDDLPLVLADADRIRQVLNNLVTNAMKFTPEKGHILVAAHREEDHVRVSVEDDGPGLPEIDQKELFGSRWQAPETAHLGAGLGLSIVKGIVEAHGGTVRAGNAPVRGAIFSFTLPLAPQIPSSAG